MLYNLCILLSDLLSLISVHLIYSFQIRTSVIWSTPNVSFVIPLWVIILAILLGLLVLAMLTLALWKVCCITIVTVALKKNIDKNKDTGRY